MDINRRSFIKKVGAGMLLIGSSPIILQCSGIRRKDIASSKTENISYLDNDEIEILFYASLAPSGHNTQPWLIKVVEPKHWILGTEKKRWLPQVDPDNREMLLSLGTFVENLDIAAKVYGYQIELNLLVQNITDLEITDIKLKKSAEVNYKLENIKLRRTIRNNLLPDEIKEEDFNAVSAHDYKNIYFFPNDSQAGKYLQEGTIEANRVQAQRDLAQEELADWIRWSDKDARQHRDGLTPESMEIKGIAGWFVRHFYDRKSILDVGFREKTVDLVAKQVSNCGGWMVISSRDSEISTLIETGRIFEKLFLKVRDKKIAIHPMTQLLEETPFRDKVTKELGIEGKAQFILRAGYLKEYPDPVSLRRPVSWFVSSQSKNGQK